MPELPEVETIARGLRASLIGRRIEEAVVSHPAILRTPAGRFVRMLEGAAVGEIRRLGKHIVFKMEKTGPGKPSLFWWIVHLGMTGQFVLEPSTREPRPHTHAWFELEGGRESLRYTDIRRFGRMEVAACKGENSLRARRVR